MALAMNPKAMEKLAVLSESEKTANHKRNALSFIKGRNEKISENIVSIEKL